MKKIIVLFFIIFLFGICSFNDSFLTFLTQLDKNSKISFYCTEKNNFENCEEIKNGEGYIYTFDAKDVEGVVDEVSGCCGFSVKFFDVKKLENVLGKINVIKNCVVDGIKIFYGEASGLNFVSFLQNKKINVQVAVMEDCFVVGSPLILGSY